MKSSNQCTKITKANSTVTFTICGSVNHKQWEIRHYSALDWPAREERMMPTMSPYSANASAKMRMRIIPTKSFGC
ncbi:V-type proton ATPase 16 kDa proteolipid subunit [Trifolium repens]|nr:V-type proton ATPase 16 kDa proteolipid subunit [Trifolium repens]